jgi:CBS domain containing-hemolysin-like protein
MNEPPGDSGPNGSAGSALPSEARPAADNKKLRSRFRDLLRRLRRARNGEASTRDALAEMIEDREEAEAPLDKDERTLVANILALRDCTVADVMVPRADIVAIESQLTIDEVIETMTREQHSRLPVFRETLDDAIGMVHVKDVLAWRGANASFALPRILRPVLFVAPSMRVLELLLEMRIKRCHMALVVDEFGGVDGLVTIEDLVEQIVGEIEDEHDIESEPQVVRRPDGSFDADARTPVEVLEEEFGEVLTDEERQEVDTLAGLVFALAGRVPIRGELITHASGIEFEVLDADPRRIRRLRLRRRNHEAVAAAPSAPLPQAGAR